MSSTKTLTIIVILLIPVIIATLVFFFTPTFFLSKKTTTLNPSVVLENSYLFASPLQAKADGKEQIRITVFLLDGRGIGVANQKVKLILPQMVNVIETQSTSDDTGKTVFDLSSVSSAKLTIKAEVNGREIPQKVKISFY